MKNIKKLTFNTEFYPDKLRNISSPPSQLFYLGNSLEELFKKPAVGVVGSRRVTPYGRAVTTTLAGNLAKQGVVIISGLALGVDAVAHQAAIDGGGKTIAVMPCGLDRIYPSTNRNLATRILEHGGALISEYAEETDARRENFIARNRIVSGLSDGVLITEAAERSGTLHTANFALEQGREVMAVPGNITSPLSAGTNNLIKAGATPVTEIKDILRALGLETKELEQQELLGKTKEEYTLLNLIKAGVTESDLLLAESKLDPRVFNQTLTMLEITGRIKPMGNGRWVLA